MNGANLEASAILQNELRGCSDYESHREAVAHALGYDEYADRMPYLPYVVFAVAALLVTAAAMMRTWAAAYLQSEVVHDPEMRTASVVADGPYRHVRNPLYLANILMSFGLGLMASRLGWVVIVVGMLIFMYRLIGREEAALLAGQGERYRAYHAAVPRLWPALAPRLPSAGSQARWRQAWRGEAFFWGFALASAAFAATLQLRYFGAIFVADFLFYVLLLPLWQRSRERSAHS